MGMIGHLLRVPKQDLEKYRNDSSLLQNKINEEEADEENPRLVDIDKAWDGILFLLTGQNVANTDHPLAKVLFSEQFIDEDQDLGYGPAHYLNPEQVIDLNTVISGITVDQLKQKYDPKRMEELEVYPSVWMEEGDEAFEYLAGYFEDLKRVYSIAANNGEAIVTFIS